MLSDCISYQNTSENAQKIGWSLTPEYCFGDKNAKYVTHDHHHGKFYFHNVDVDGWLPE